MAHSYALHADTLGNIRRMHMLGKIVIVAAFAVIIYNLGAGLYYMMVDKGGSDRVVKALTRRIALSVGLILLVVLGIWMGWIQPHGVGV
jgi:succinate dehydrogenase/fumarate reductase cytochrome b subunit